MAVKVLGVIPARYGSTRLAGKPLLDIAGKPMIEHVYGRAAAARYLDELIVATDDERIVKAVEAFGGKAAMTDPGHRSGTDRCAELAGDNPQYEVIVNIQGDEPLLDPAAIDHAVSPLLVDPSLEMSTVAKVMRPTGYGDQNCVKVVMNLAGNALYFSRSLIPFPRSGAARVYEHIGLYCYRREILLHLARLPRTPLETAESLEQLRALEHGYRIRVVVTEATGESPSVDTPEDLARVRAILGRLQNPEG